MFSVPCNLRDFEKSFTHSDYFDSLLLEWLTDLLHGAEPSWEAHQFTACQEINEWLVTEFSLWNVIIIHVAVELWQKEHKIISSSGSVLWSRQCGRYWHQGPETWSVQVLWWVAGATTNWGWEGAGEVSSDCTCTLRFIFSHFISKTHNNAFHSHCYWLFLTKSSLCYT